MNSVQQIDQEILLELAFLSQIQYYDFTILLDMCQYMCIYVDSRGVAAQNSA